MQLQLVPIPMPEGANVIIGQSHFIKTVEDIYEAVVNTNPGIRFGLAFNEASGPCLVRHDGNDDALRSAAVEAAQAIGAGHVFVLFLRDGFPINLTGRLRDVPEVVRLFCATANPLQVIVAESEQGRGVLGVIDGSSPKGVEDEDGIAWRRDFLRKIGYKR
ncbi:MAG: adenosine-specific kinase [Bryobacterales bacterium]|nr:adenosine-specific kinase [Bryobacterales bacterium]